MVVKINEYYSHEIDKVKEVYIKDNYELKSRKAFISIYVLFILWEFMQIKKDISIAAVLIYTIPFVIGTFVELYEIKKYSKLELGLEKIRKLLYISLVSAINLYLFFLSAIFVIGKDVFANISYRNNHVDVSTVLIIIALMIHVSSIIMFFVGIKIEIKQVTTKKKKKYVPAAILGALIPIGILLFRDISYIYLLIPSMVLVIFIGCGIGNIYFRYRNFDKKVTENDKIIDYKL